MAERPLVPYVDQLLAELVAIATDYTAVLQDSAIVNVDPNRGGSQGMTFIGFAHWGWATSSEDLQARRMALLARVRSFRPRFLLLFPHPTPEIEKRHAKALDLFERWLSRKRGDKAVPASVPNTVAHIQEAVATLRKVKDLLPQEPFATHVVVDTNVLLDDPDLAALHGRPGSATSCTCCPSCCASSTSTSGPAATRTCATPLAALTTG